MIIYQLHKYGDSYEHYYDHIIGSYLRKERAEEERVKAKKDEDEKRSLALQCNRCPYHKNIKDNKLMADLMRKHCDHSDIHCDDNGELFCKAYYYHWVCSKFEIEEVDVED